ncbi:G-protein coupled receptor moody-like [Parasteatoda tepidariorum]|uniref:G-protein coupled receptor moody-like n=1 Tax=Parasteatoda tepidariorum TaxID=114398 RepID=UPI001C71ECF2|nr:G-protein coupled receptor moody-like [Parasteatoda tepidariorum]
MDTVYVDKILNFLDFSPIGFLYKFYINFRFIQKEMNTSLPEIFFPFRNNSLDNDTLDMNQEQDRSDKQEESVIAQVVFLIISSLGIFGNSVSILALKKSKKLRGPTDAFVTTLCVADLLFCIITIINYSRPDWNRNHTFCLLITWAKFLVAGESLYLMIGITINRYICIIYPKYYRLIYRKKYLVLQLTLTWMYTFIHSLLPFFGVVGKYGYEPNSGLCILLRHYGITVPTFFFIHYFAFPATVFVICYSRIFWVTHKASQHVRKQCNLSVKRKELDPTATSLEIQRGDFPDRVDDKEMKILKVMLVVIAAFLICYFPMTIIHFFDSDAKIPTLTALSHLGLNLSNVINPIIYVAMCAEFRKACFELFTCKQVRLPLSTSSNNTATS